MRKTLFYIITLFTLATFAQTPNAKSVKFKPQDVAITSPIKGQLYFNNPSLSFWYHDGSQWVELTAGEQDLLDVILVDPVAEADADNGITLNVKTAPYFVDFKFYDPAKSQYTKFYQDSENLTLYKSVIGSSTTIGFRVPITTTITSYPSPLIGLETTILSDTCSGAIPLFVGEPRAGTTLGYTDDAPPNCAIFASNAAGVWYKITGNGYENTFTCTGNFSIKLNVYTGDCGNLICEPTATGNGSATVVIPTATINQEYFIYVTGTGSSEGTFELNRTSLGSGIDDVLGQYHFAYQVNDIKADLTGNVSLRSINIPYDNTASGLTGDDLQSVIDELAASGSGSVSKTIVADTGTVIDLSNIVGTESNFLSANSNIAYTTTGTGGYNIVLVNAESEPTINGNTNPEIGGSFIVDTDIYLVVRHTTAGVKYFWSYKDISPVSYEYIQIALTDLTTDITTGTTKGYFRMPYEAVFISAKVSLIDAGTVTGISVDILENNTTTLSTLLTTDATEETSTTATTPLVISDNTLANDSKITFDFSVVPTNGLGVIVTLQLVQL